MGEGSINDKSALFGLIGFPLSHSFSKKYFNAKFDKEGYSGHYYELFPIESIEKLPKLVATHPNLMGLNVTIPYKEAVLPFLDKINDEAKRIGAVNTIRIKPGKLEGFNTDVYGFEVSLSEKINITAAPQALVLGTGGASKAVAFVFDKLGIPFRFVSRSKKSGHMTYEDLTPDTIANHSIIVNTTPLGMTPNIDTKPALPYDSITSGHLLYDLVYNPETTSFLREGIKRGATTINGLRMLHLQAEKAWLLWNQ